MWETHQFYAFTPRMTEFIAIDGEADDRGNYILLCDSTGRTLHRPDGISTVEALSWLLALPAKHELVVFGLNYDVNQWIKDIGERELRRLADDGRTIWRLRYDITWVPTKFFIVKDLKTGRRVKLCEVFGFYQTSFVNALKAWGFTPPREVVSMKARRGTFTGKQLDEVIAYCQQECRLLVRMMDRLAAACQSADCEPGHGQWIGAGAIATQLLTRNNVKEHHRHDRALADRQVVETAILGAYYGGRVEMLLQGMAPRVETVDIRSAYPFAAMGLPSLADAALIPVQARHYHPNGHDTVWRVSWENQSIRNLAPFPVRLKDGAICYPRSGSGWYHHFEVETALKMGYSITIHEGYYLTGSDDDVSNPFAWISEAYERRAAMKAAGDPAEKALKLGLNSVYGKLAQGYGSTPAGPPFQSYWWAGKITATTRAMMLVAAMHAKHPMLISTDGVFCADSGIPDAHNTSIGAWEHGQLDAFFVAQPGVYHGYADGREVTKSRGFFAKEVNYAELRDEWQQHRHEGVYHYRSRRFIGLKVALIRNRLDLWRTWPEDRRSITLEPQRKIITDATGHAGMTVCQPLPGPHESLPYTPKQSLYDDPTDEQLEHMMNDDQPHINGV